MYRGVTGTLLALYPRGVGASDAVPRCSLGVLAVRRGVVALDPAA